MNEKKKKKKKAGSQGAAALWYKINKNINYYKNKYIIKFIIFMKKTNIYKKNEIFWQFLWAKRIFYV